VNHHCSELPVVLLHNVDRSWSETEIAEIEDLVKVMETGLKTAGHPTFTATLDGDKLARVMRPFNPNEVIVFNWCEEIPGVSRSAGLLARQLEDLGFTYTGADAQALQFSYNKPAVKESLSQYNVPSPRWMIADAIKPGEWDCFPAIIKPAFEHSSIGITHEAVVHSFEELARQVEKVRANYNQPVMVEDFIDGREFHVTVAGNGKLQVFPIAEMDFSAIGDDRGRLCTYDSKFDPASPDYQIIQLKLPAELSNKEKKQLEEVAIAGYKASDCRDYGRLDIRLRDGIFYVLDVNPNADISPDTSVTLSAELAGYPYSQFCSLLVQLAAKRHPVFGREKAGKIRQEIPVMVPGG
jgi:D-alanine-D-alanine ligase